MIESGAHTQPHHPLVLKWALARHLETSTQVLSHDFKTVHPFTRRGFHSYQVEITGRYLAQFLDADIGIVEMGAFLHDIGHPPFGHAGEHALNEIASEVGLTFDHNKHGLKKLIDMGAPSEVIEVMRDKTKTKEGKIIDLADDITWESMDLAEGVIVGILDPESTDFQKLKLYQAALKRATDEGLGVNDFGEEGWLNLALMLRDVLIDNVVERYRQDGVVDFTPKVKGEFSELREFLYKNFYHSPTVDRMWDRDHEVLHNLAAALQDRPELLPPDRRDPKDAVERIREIIEHLSSLSEVEIRQLYEKAFGEDSWIEL